MFGQVKEDEMGGACSTNGGRGMHIGFWWESRKEKDLEVDGRIILKWILER
jgi:hypothetical protein